MRTQSTIQCSPTVGSARPNHDGAFSTPLLNRRTRSPKSRYNFYVKVDAAAILPDHLKQWSDYANYLQHRIVVGRMYWQGKDTGFIPLHRRTLERFIHHSILNPVLKWMIKNRVIERDGSRDQWTGFTPAQRRDGTDGVSIGYRFCDAYEHLPTRRIACRSVKANNKFRRLQNKPVRMQNYTKVHLHLRHWLRRLQLDLPTALKLVEAASLEPSIAEQVVDLSTYIANGDATELTVCNYGRVHTAVTRLLAPIRSCLLIGGQPLTELDVACSQPLFLAIHILKTIGNPRINTLPGILNHNIVGSNNNKVAPIYSFLNSNFLNSITITPTTSTPPPYLLYDPRKSTESYAMSYSSNTLQQNNKCYAYLPSDLLFFVKLCSIGELYDYLMKQSGWSDDRVSFKQEFFHMLYGPIKDSLMHQVMAQEFPSVMAFIVWHKGRHGYKELSRQMQRAESQLVIEGVCGNLMVQNPNIPLVTIHDSIMTTRAFVPVVRATIMAAFQKSGIQPTVRAKETAFESAMLPSSSDTGSSITARCLLPPADSWTNNMPIGSSSCPTPR